MRKIYFLSAFIIIVFSINTTFGQKTARQNKPVLPQQMTKIELTNAAAFADGSGGALIEWTTSGDKPSVGFNLYRIGNGGKTIVNPDFIAGTAIKSGALKADENSFSFFDAGGELGAVYQIEATDLDGNVRLFDSFDTRFDGNVGERAAQAPNFAEVLNQKPESIEAQREFPAPLAEKYQTAEGNNSVLDANQTQRLVAAQPGVKIAVKKEGLYRVTKTELAAAGYDVNAQVNFLQLYADGIEQPILITGVQNGRLSDGGYVEFYGRGVDTIWSDTKIYYLVVGTTQGLRMTTNSRRLNPYTVASANFSSVLERKERVNYATQILNGDADNYFGGVITPTQSAPNYGVNVLLDLRGVDTAAAQFTIKASVQGFTTVAHRVCVVVNPTLNAPDPQCTEGFVLDGSGRVLMQQQVTLPGSRLVEGINRIRFFSLNAAGDNNLVDFVRITYSRLYQASNNSLTFTTQASRAARITVFTTSNIRVFDITDPNNVGLVGADISGSNGNFQAVVASKGARTLVAVGEGAQMSAAAVTFNTPSTALTTALNKNLVIITHGDFLTAANSLAAYRRTQGLTVEVVNIEDVNDESGFGTASPYVIKSFLQAVNPNYALMFGDATYNPKAYPSSGGTPPVLKTFVQTKLVDTLFGEAPSDEFLGDFNSDNISDFPIGRITADTAGEAQTVVNKIMSFESTVSTRLMQDGAVFTCDVLDYDFCGSLALQRDKLPAAMPSQFIRRDDNGGDIETIRQRIIAQINLGRFLTVYSGHGSSSAWTSGQIFKTSDVPLLTNINKLNMFLPLNCLNGNFAIESGDSLGEAMIKSPNGGSVVGWSSSGDTFPDSQELMALRFFQGLGNGEFARMGDAVRTSKFATSDPDVRATWILLGDPTLKIK